jgi:16S rRNA processing protein RimM
MEEVDLEYIKTSNSNIISKIKSIDDIDAIKLFGQKDVYVLRSELPQLAENEAYWFELIGMDVINLDNQSLGVVEIVNNKFIISINKSENSILVDWEEDY